MNAATPLGAYLAFWSRTGKTLLKTRLQATFYGLSRATLKMAVLLPGVRCWTARSRSPNHRRFLNFVNRMVARRKMIHHCFIYYTKSPFASEHAHTRTHAHAHTHAQTQVMFVNIDTISLSLR